jgi:hypothetical protein
MHGKVCKYVMFEAPTRLTRLDDWAFCDSTLREFVVPLSVVEIGKFCFHVCQSLSILRFNDGGALRFIDDHAFSHTGLRELFVPKTVEQIGRHCFDSCKLLATVEFEEPSALARIQEGAFLSCCMNQVKIPTCTYLDRGQVFPEGCLLIQEWKPVLSEFNAGQSHSSSPEVAPSPQVNVGIVAPLTQHRDVARHIITPTFPLVPSQVPRLESSLQQRGRGTMKQVRIGVAKSQGLPGVTLARRQVPASAESPRNHQTDQANQVIRNTGGKVLARPRLNTG